MAMGLLDLDTLITSSRNHVALRGILPLREGISCVEIHLASSHARALFLHQHAESVCFAGDAHVFRDAETTPSDTALAMLEPSIRQSTAPPSGRRAHGSAAEPTLELVLVRSSCTPPVLHPDTPQLL
jgi:hypothetical protein